jgi:hypothetical protein
MSTSLSVLQKASAHNRVAMQVDGGMHIHQY